MDKALENIMILLQRRYNFLREIGRLTDELAEATERRDTVSASLLLEMRGNRWNAMQPVKENCAVRQKRT